MKRGNLAKIPQGFAFDTETWRTEPGIAAPNLVCASVYRGGKGDLLDKPQALETFLTLLQNSTLILANAPYDMLVMIAHAAKHGKNIIPLCFQAYRDQRVYDVLLAEALHALAEGHLGIHTKTNAPTYYSLEDTVSMVIGRDDAKANDVWRKDYRILDGIPLDMWPAEARTYPVDDVRNTWDVAQAQIARNKNLHDLQNQQYTDFCLRLGAAWGLTVDPHAIDSLESKTIEDRAERQVALIAHGYLTAGKGGKVTKNTAYVKRKVAVAFGVSGVCPKCEGTGRVPGETKHAHCQGAGCAGCADGKVPKLKKDGTPASYKGCEKCSGTGLDLSTAPYPITDAGGVSTSRDALNESGDDELLEFAAYDETAKILSTYLPWLRSGLRDGQPTPLVLRPRVLKETGRIGYGDVVHQLPQDLGVRECLVARPGWNLISCDWEGAELITHAQSCYDLVGWSKMGDALNTGIKVHDQLGAKIGGVTYEAMVNRSPDDKLLANYRQSAKPANFGFPGLMGAPTLVIQQRKNGPDTYGPDGRRYKGLRFCILAGGAQSCGHVKVTEWGPRGRARQITPTCVRCIEVAEDIRQAWLATWSENLPYFDLVKQIHAKGYMVQHYTRRVRKGMSVCATANGFFQGLAGDAMKLAIQWMSYEMYCDRSSDLFGARLILPVHDEAIAEAPADHAPAAAARISAIMVAALSEMCPKMARIIKAEAALMTRWTKAAGPVFDEHGGLIPWECT